MGKTFYKFRVFQELLLIEEFLCSSLSEDITHRQCLGIERKKKGNHGEYEGWQPKFENKTY